VSVLEAGAKEEAVGWGDGVTLAPHGTFNAAFLNIDGHACVFTKE
jgi:hypothetical protein